MVGLYDKYLRVEGVIGKYTLRFVPIVDRYILFVVSFASAPILNQNFIVRDVVDRVPSYDLKSQVDKVIIQLVVALDDVLIGGKFTQQSMIGALIHINAADFLFSKFTHPRINLSIHGMILPYLKRSEIYGKRYKDISENSCLENIRTTQIRKSSDFFISKRHYFPVNSYNLGIVITNLPICNERAKNCKIYVSGYPFYDCPHYVNHHSKFTIVRTPDFYGNYAAIAQNIKTRFVRKFVRRFEKSGEDINLNDPLKEWSRTDVENLSLYFQSTEAKCWQRIIPTTPRPKIRTITRRPESRYDLRPRFATITTTTTITTTERISEAKIRRPTENEGKVDVLNYTKEDSAVKFKNKTLDIQREEGLEQSMHSVKNESSKAGSGNHANITIDRLSIREDIKKKIKVSPENLERPPTVQPEKNRNNTSKNESLYKAGSKEYGNVTVDRPSVGKDIKKEIKVSLETLERPATASPEKIRNNIMKEDKLHNALIVTKKSVTKPNTTLEMNQSSGSKSKTTQVSVKTVLTTSKPLNVSRHEQIKIIKPDALKNRTETRNAISGLKMEPSRSPIINVTATTPKSTIEQTIGRTPSTKSEKSDSRITGEEKKSIPTSNPNDKSKSLVTSVISEKEKKSNSTISTTVRPKSIVLKTKKPIGAKIQKNETLDKTITVTPKQVNTSNFELMSTVNRNVMNETNHMHFNRSIIRVYSRTPDLESMDFFDEELIPKKKEVENKGIENTQPTLKSNPSDETKNDIDSKTLKQKGTSNLNTTTDKPVTVSSNGKVITPKIDALKSRTDTNNTRNGSEIKPPYLLVKKVNSTTSKSTEKASETVEEGKVSSPIDNPRSTITSLTPKSTEKSSLRNLTTPKVKNMTVNNDKAKQLNVSNPERTQKEKSNGLKYEIDVKNAINVSKNASPLQPITIVNTTTPKTIIEHTIKENPSTKISKSENGTIGNKTVITSSLNENDEKKSPDTLKEQKLVKESGSQNLTTTNPIKAESEILAINKLDQLNSKAENEVDRRNIIKSRPVDNSKTERTNIANPNGLKNDTNVKNVMNNLDKENPPLIIGGNTSIIATTPVEQTHKKRQIAEAQKSETETIVKDANSTFTLDMVNKRKSLGEDLKKIENTSISDERSRKIKEKLINETTHKLTLPLSTDGSSDAINHLKINDSNSTAMLSTSSNRDHKSTAHKGNLKTTEVQINAKNSVASKKLSIVGNNPPSSVSFTSTSRGLTEQTAEKSSVEKKVISRNEIFKSNLSLLEPLKINNSNPVGSNNQTINTDFTSPVNTLMIKKLMTPNVNSTTSNQETITTVNKNNTRTSRKEVNGQNTGNPKNLSTNSTPHQSNNSSITTPTLPKIKNFIRVNDSDNITSNNQSLNLNNLIPLDSLKIEESMQQNIDPLPSNQANISAVDENETAIKEKKVNITDAVDPKNLLKGNSSDQSKDFAIATPPFLKNKTYERVNDSNKVTLNNQSLNADNLSPHNSLNIEESIPQNNNLTTSNQENITAVNENETANQAKKVNVTDAVDLRNLLKRNSSDQSKDFAISTSRFLKNKTSGRINDSNNVTSNNQILIVNDLSSLNSLEIRKSIEKNVNLTTSNTKNITTVNGNETAMSVEKVSITDVVDPKNLQKEDSPDQPKDLAIAAPLFLDNKTYERINDSYNDTSNNQSLKPENLSSHNSLKIEESIPQHINLTESNQEKITVVNRNKTAMSVQKGNITDAVEPKNVLTEDSPDQPKDLAIAAPPFLDNKTYERINDSFNDTTNNQSLNLENLSLHKSLKIEESIPQNINLTTLNQDNFTAVNNNETAISVEKVNITDAVDPENLLTEDSPDQPKDLAIATPPFLENETYEKINDSITVTSNNQSSNADNLSPLNSLEIGKSIPKYMNLTTSNHGNITAINRNETAMSVEKVNTADAVDPNNLLKENSPDQPKDLAIATPPFLKNETYERINDSITVTSNNQSSNADNLSPLNSLENGKSIQKYMNLTTSNHENITAINETETATRAKKVNITDAVNPKNLPKANSSDQSKDFAIAMPPFSKNETFEKINDSINVTSNNQSLNADNENITANNVNETAMSVKKVNIIDAVDSKNILKEDSSDQSKNFSISTLTFLKNETSGRMNDSNNVTTNNQTLNADDLSLLNSQEIGKSIVKNMNPTTWNEKNITTVNGNETAISLEKVNISDVVDPKNLQKKDSFDQSKNFANVTTTFQKNETSARMNDSNNVTTNNQTLNADDLSLLNSQEIGKLIPKNVNSTTSNPKNLTAVTKNEKVMSTKKLYVRNAEYPVNLFKNVSFDESNDSVTSILHVPNYKISGKVNDSDEVMLNNQSLYTLNLSSLNFEKLKKSMSKNINSSLSNQENVSADNKNKTAITKTKKFVKNAEDSIILSKNVTLVPLNYLFYYPEAIRELFNRSQLVDSSQSTPFLFGSTISFPIPFETLTPTTATNFLKISNSPYIIEEKMAKANNFSSLHPSIQVIYNDYLFYNASQSSSIPSDHLPEDNNSKILEIGSIRSPASIIDIFSDLSLKSTSTESTDQPDHPIVQLSGISNDKEFSSSSTQPTTESKNSDSAEKISDTTMLIFYASFSLPILLAVAYIFYVISLILRRRCRSHLE